MIYMLPGPDSHRNRVALVTFNIFPVISLSPLI